MKQSIPYTNSNRRCLVRKKTPIILVNSDQVVLYVHIDSENMQVRIASTGIYVNAIANLFVLIKQFCD